MIVHVLLIIKFSFTKNIQCVYALASSLFIALMYHALFASHVVDRKGGILSNR